MTGRICGFEGCGRPHYARNVCEPHYQQLKAGKELRPLRVRMPVGGECAFLDCGRPNAAAGFCWTHYEMSRTGQELRPIATRVNECLVPECARKHYALGLCQRHHRACANYGLSVEAVIELFTDAHCRICSATDSGVKDRDFHIDHDHACCPERGRSCGKCVRGILCYGCNVGLGSFGDDVARLRAAIAYLEAA